MIQTHPLLEDGTPFPTLWWLTCKRLSAEVGRREASGLIKAINDRIGGDDRFATDLSLSTSRYIATRDRIHELGSVGHPGGGPLRVKCLHAHVGHDLVTGDNPVGRLTLEEIGWSDPLDPCV